MKKKQEQQPTKNSRRSHEYVKLEEAVNSRYYVLSKEKFGFDCLFCFVFLEYLHLCLLPQTSLLLLLQASLFHLSEAGCFFKVSL
jgi:hypothetical protein